MNEEKYLIILKGDYKTSEISLYDKTDARVQIQFENSKQFRLDLHRFRTNESDEERRLKVLLTPLRNISVYQLLTQIE